MALLSRQNQRKVELTISRRIFFPNCYTATGTNAPTHRYGRSPKRNHFFLPTEVLPKLELIALVNREGGGGVAGKSLDLENDVYTYSSTMSSGSLTGTLVNDFSLQFTMPPSSHEHGCGHWDFWSSTPGPHSTVSPSKSPSAEEESPNDRELPPLPRSRSSWFYHAVRA